jgi:hypothetical protein
VLQLHFGLKIEIEAVALASHESAYWKPTLWLDRTNRNAPTRLGLAGSASDHRCSGSWAR